MNDPNPFHQLNIKKIPGRWISMLYRLVMVEFGRRIGDLELSKGQYQFMVFLFIMDAHEKGLPQDMLSEWLSIDKGTTARSLYKMEQAGYVRRERDAADRRQNIVFLTEKALSIRDDFYKTVQAVNAVVTDGFTDEERDVFGSLLRRAAKNMRVHVTGREESEETEW